MECAPSVPDLVSQLRVFHGFRTLWLDEGRRAILHAEPEEELEAHGYRYVATLMQPGPEELAEALARIGLRPVVAEQSSPGLGWSAVSEPVSA